MKFVSTNPYTEESFFEIEAHSNDQVDQKITRAHETFLSWRTTSFDHRAQLMRKAAAVMRDDKEKYARLMVQEMGKVISEATGEMEKCALVCEYYADNAEEFLKDQPLNPPEGEAYVAYDPIGVVLAIMPWNFPYWQVFRFAAPALMAGNVGLLKHASNVPQCAMAIEEIFLKAGFPEGCFTNLLIDKDQVARVIEKPEVRAATLTGSERAGTAVAGQAGKYLKKTVLELGGSDPFIVLEDVDVDEVAKIAVTSRMINCGQSCIAAKRFLIADKIFDDFTQAFIRNLEGLIQGDPMDEGTDYASMAREDLAGELLDQVARSKDQGAQVLYGGDRPDVPGAFFNPSILSEVTPGMPAYEEELFGPVATFFRVATIDQAVEIANRSPYGLGGSVWTKDLDLARKLVRRVDSGAVYINKMMASHPTVPFGGVKRSGYGRELAHLGIREFMNQKTVWIG